MAASDDRSRDPIEVTNVYGELRGIAERVFRGQREAHTLQATALVHEAWIRLAGRARDSYVDGPHFFAAAARAMRHVLVDHARRVAADKRGGDALRVTLSGGEVGAVDAAPTDVLDLERALGKLEREDARMGQVIELKFFAGLTLPEIADALGISKVTVSADWKKARLWLARELT